jgi:hypothetical protein
MRFGEPESPAQDAVAWWQSLTRLSLGEGLLDHAFEASRLQLPAVVSRGGVVPARCWGGPGDTDHRAAVAIACVQLGAWVEARRILEAAESALHASSSVDRMRLHDAWQQYASWTGDDLPLPAAEETQSREPQEGRGRSTAQAAAAETASRSTVDILAAARACLGRGEVTEAASRIAWLGGASGSRAGTWFTAYDEAGEPVADDGDDASVSSRAWAEIVQLAVGQIIGLRPDADGVRVQPRLLPGVDRLSARVRVREMTVHLEVVADEAVGAGTEYLLPYGTGDVTAQIKARRAPAASG